MRQVTKLFFICCIFVCTLIWIVSQVQAQPLVQQPTVDVPTVTSTPPIALVTVLTSQDQANLRSGPSTLYALVGILVAGQQVPGLGRSAGGEWIQVAYPGVPGGAAWIFYQFVKVDGVLPIVAPPPTPTLQVTPTVDLTLAAEFQIEATATRLPTFTAPPPLDIPTFQADTGGLIGTGVPMGYLIIALAVLGFLGILISILGRR